MDNNNIYIKASEYVFELFRNNPDDKRIFHDFNHCSDVANTALKMGHAEDLNNEELEILTVAGWFHDAGYIFSNENYEDKSAELARGFMAKLKWPEEKIEKTVKCILATKATQNPEDLLEEIICDASLYYLGKKSFFEKTDLLRIEQESCCGKRYSDSEWYKKNIDLMTSNTFYTRYAREEYEKQRTENFIKLKKRHAKKQKQENELTSKSEHKKQDELQKKDKKLTPERGIETMFRITSTNHIRLSGMADNKAHIMITVTTILISVVVSFLLRKLDSNPHLIIPTIMLLLTCLLTLVFAVLVTKPKITSGTFTREDIDQKKANLLFFGNFFNMSIEDFEWGMKEMMKDHDYLYGSMIRDFYFLGKVLGQKYRYLSICYNVFMYGIIATVAAYIIAVALYPGITSIY